MKKPLPYIILGIGIAIFVGCYFFFKKRNECKKSNQQLLEEHTFKVMQKIKEGYRIFQHIDDRGKYSGVFYVKKGHEFKRAHGPDIYKDCNKHQETLCQGSVVALKESGFFEEIEEKDFIYWKLILT